jgi:hypothetical protein
MDQEEKHHNCTDEAILEVRVVLLDPAIYNPVDH